MRASKTLIGWIPAHPCYGSVSMLRYWNALSSAWLPEDLYDLHSILPNHFQTEQIRHQGTVMRMWIRKIAYPFRIITRQKGQISHILDHSWADMLPHVPGNLPKIVTVHDLIPLRFPGELTPQQTNRFRKIVEHIRDADMVICVSQYTKKEVMEFLEIPADKIRVISNGVEEFPISNSGISCIQRKISSFHTLHAQLSTPFYLGCIGNTSERKNLAILGPALKKAKAMGMEILLVRAGALLPTKLRDDLHSAIGADHIIELGPLKDDELAPYYQFMDAIAIPSTYEGFGLPVLEAMAAGTAVISSNATSLPEVGGEAALYFNPLSVDEFVDCLIACRDKKVRDRLVKLGTERVKYFSWRRCLEETYDVYSELLGLSHIEEGDQTGLSSASSPAEVKVAAVFASYNRHETAIECVRCLKSQTRPIDQVVIGENASQDGTADALRAMKWDKLEILDIGDNLGNAGGIKAAMDHAFENGADAVWILDDDSWPEPEALEKLLAAPWNPEVVRHSVQIDPRNGMYSWPLPLIGKFSRWKTLRNPEDWPVGEYAVESRAAWTGALIPRKVWESVGPVLDTLFIRGEDEEYPRRISAAGFHFEAVRDSVLMHPSANGLICWSMFGKQFWYEIGLTPWKLYYEARNTIWIKCKNREWFHAFGITLLFILALLIHGPLTKDHIKSLYEAIIDAWTGRLGKKQF